MNNCSISVHSTTINHSQKTPVKFSIKCYIAFNEEHTYSVSHEILFLKHWLPMMSILILINNTIKQKIENIQI